MSTGPTNENDMNSLLKTVEDFQIEMEDATRVSF